MGQEVWLMNPKSVWQKISTGTISGIGGEHQFHCMPIPENWFKVDIRVALQGDVALMFANEAAE
jgi:hypothetical protein